MHFNGKYFWPPESRQRFVDGFKVGGASGLLAASVFHFGKYKINEVKEKLKKEGLPARI